MLHAKAAASREPHDLSLVVGGPLYQAYLRTHLADPPLGLERAWRIGAAEYGVLGSHYVEGFRRKWLHPHPHTRESLIGSADVQSLADLANAFDVIREMYLVPITKRALLRLVVAIALPLLPLVLTMIPFEEIVDRAIKTFI
jgi:hypothetical protein